MKYHYIYQITNNLNSKIYVGVHSSTDLNDNYMGSGVALQHAYNKYGIANFTKVILHIFDTRDQANESEAEIVNEQFVSRRDTYNIMPGGLSVLHTDESKAKISAGNKGKKVTDTSKMCMAQQKVAKERVNPFKGKKHTAESKQKMSDSIKANPNVRLSKLGKNNPNYGKVYTDEEKAILSAKLSGENHPNWGKPHSDETRERQRLAARARVYTDKVCPHCSKEGRGPAMSRYHFDNCSKR